MRICDIQGSYLLMCKLSLHSWHLMVPNCGPYVWCAEQSFWPEQPKGIKLKGKDVSWKLKHKAKFPPEIHFKIVQVCMYKMRFTKFRTELLEEEIPNGSTLGITE